MKTKYQTAGPSKRFDRIVNEPDAYFAETRRETERELAEQRRREREAERKASTRR